MPDEKNVSAGKAPVTGAIFRAPLGTTLPENATDTLNVAFKSLGYVSEDGLTNGNAMDAETIKAWGGDVVLATSSGRDDTFAYTLIESINEEVLKSVYGDDNVEEINVGSGDAAHTEIKVAVNSDELEEYSYVIETILKGNKKKRFVIPRAKVTSVGDVVYKDNEPIGYNLTLMAFPDETGNKHYEYIK